MYLFPMGCFVGQRVHVPVPKGRIGHRGHAPVPKGRIGLRAMLNMDDNVM